MYDFYFVRGITNNTTKTRIIDFLAEQNIWMRNQIENNNDPLWRHVSYIVSQYDGLLQGYNSASNDLMVCIKIKFKDFLKIKFRFFWLKLRSVTPLEFDIMNDSGDLLDLQNAVNPNERPNFHKMQKYELDNYLLKMTHCSALVKVSIFINYS